MGVDHRAFYVLVPEQFLDGADVLDFNEMAFAPIEAPF
jgi:hypothetical protein